MKCAAIAGRTAGAMSMGADVPVSDDLHDASGDAIDQPLPGRFILDRSRNATAQVFEHLRELIVTLALKPGAILSRPALSNYFALSQTPVRDALTRLGEERLVDIYPQHATRVSAIDLSSARQAHFLRLSLELEIVSVLAHGPNPQMEKLLLGLVSRQRHHLQMDDLENFTRADMEFHLAMYQQAQVADLWSTMRSKSGHLDRLRRMHLSLNGKAQSILAQHTQIARLIGAGDADKAREHVRAHLSGTLRVLDILRAQDIDKVLPDSYSPDAFAVHFHT
jgi:DNA-binding GntR family transcriptional regulator